MDGEHQPTDFGGIYFYRTCTIDLITRLRVRYDLDALRLAEPDDIL